MSGRSGQRRDWRRVGGGDGLDAGVPEAAHGGRLFLHPTVQFTKRKQGGPGAGRQVGPKPRQRARLLEHPRELAAGRLRKAVQDDRQPEIEA
jgi:hypothetical protein